MKKLKHEISLTAGQAGELMAPIMEAVLTISPKRAQYWIGKKKKLATTIKEVLLGVDAYTDLISEWEEFYRDLGISCNLTDVKIPDDPGGFERVIIMAQGVTPQSAYNLCEKEMRCWRWTAENLDKIVTSDRTTKDGPYAIRIRNRVEADEELKNLSANQLKEQRIAGITLEERLIYELKYFKETGEHLDIKNITLCTGSRYSGGGVPHVSWGGSYGELRVGGYSPGSADGNLRARVAV